MSRFSAARHFDVMSHLALGAPLQPMKRSDRQWIVSTLERALMALRLHLPIWAYWVLSSIPSPTQDVRTYVSTCNQMMDERIAV